jgi:hypothetical protein
MHKQEYIRLVVVCCREVPFDMVTADAILMACDMIPDILFGQTDIFDHVLLWLPRSIQ